MGAEGRPQRPAKKHSAAHYAIVGIFFITVIFGLCLYRKSQRREADARFLRDVLVIQEALRQYVELASGDADLFQAVRSKRLKEMVRSCSIGGNWKLERRILGDGQAVTGFVVEHPARSIQEMEAFDRDLDDGSLASGKFAIRGHGIYSIDVLTTLAPAVEDDWSRIINAAADEAESKSHGHDANYVAESD
ncbi:MAG: hypothetical protein LBP65_01485 [Puniceicoccales bacterium]|jgi:hypothetical protein|nr:hypothetical protein [Puniceicoccales bacterium]